ncbi:MAG: hypothetical protein OEW77_06880, partial [Gemmatimonadota bacterium]|nr:hypothetical protein [Gemmatimonadota bacterium]
MYRNKPGHLATSFALAALVLLTVACAGDSPTGPKTGSVRIATTTTGADLDADGYQFAIDGGTAQAIGVNAAVTVSDLTAASHSVTLSGLAANCSVSGANPRSVTVAAGVTADATFSVACLSLTGSIAVTVNATGAGLPATVNATIDGTAKGPLTIGSAATFTGYAVGNHDVQITIPANCTLASGTNPRTVAVASGTTVQTVSTTFDLACVSTSGNIAITVNATGANLPATVNATIDGTAINALTIGSAATFTGYAIGNHAVEIIIPANCTLASGLNPRTVAVPSGTTIQTVATTFALTCVSTVGNIAITVNATGANLPATVDAKIDGAGTGPGLTLGSAAT